MTSMPRSKQLQKYLSCTYCINLPCLALSLYPCHLLLLSQLLTPPSHRPTPFSHASSLFCQQQTGFFLKISLITLPHFYISTWHLCKKPELLGRALGRTGQLNCNSVATAFLNGISLVCSAHWSRLCFLISFQRKV